MTERTDLLKRLREAYAEHIPQWSILKEAADALESAGELPQEPEWMVKYHLPEWRKTSPLMDNAMDYIDTLRTAYSALADEMAKRILTDERADQAESLIVEKDALITRWRTGCEELRKLFDRQGENFCKAESRIAELERDARRLQAKVEKYRVAVVDRCEYDLEYDGKMMRMCVQCGANLDMDIHSPFCIVLYAAIDAQLATDKGEG